MSTMDRRDDGLVQLAAFRVGDEEYVIDIMRVREIIRPLPITSVRKGPKFVEGVINLRGAVIPIIDLRRRFDLPAEECPHRRIVIVMIDDERDERILPYVGDAFERCPGFSLVLLVNAEVHRVPDHHEADRYHVRMSTGVRGGQTCNPLPV